MPRSPTLGSMFGRFGDKESTIGVRIKMDYVIEIPTQTGMEYIHREISVTVNALAFNTVADVMARAVAYANQGRFRGSQEKYEGGVVTEGELTGMFFGGYNAPAINM